VAVERIAIGKLAGIEVVNLRPVGVLPDQHSQRRMSSAERRQVAPS
jgi:hypothetical protein